MAGEQMVMVGCKHPSGVVLNLDTYVRDGEQGQVRRAYGKGSVTLKGWSKPFNMPDTTERGYALTAVPADFWEQWVAEHPDFPMLLDKTIIGPHKDMSGQAKAFESVDPMFRPARVEDVKGVERLAVAGP
jgi:hypothetical protein